jgi:hypothetical protein
LFWLKILEVKMSKSLALTLAWLLVGPHGGRQMERDVRESKGGQTPAIVN